MREHVLTTTTLPPGNGCRVARTMRVCGGLIYIRGNSAPYFSLTAEIFRKGFPNQCQSFGCCHDLILTRFPRFADLAALHLSDIDGAPMYAEANGWYWLAGALGGMGERFHGGNSKGQHGGEYREPTPDECLAIFAKHCRINIAEAERIARACTVATLPNAHGADTHCAKASRDTWRAECEAMRPRWNAEAQACIARHGLVVYGDPWQAAA